MKGDDFILRNVGIDFCMVGMWRLNWDSDRNWIFLFSSVSFFYLLQCTYFWVFTLICCTYRVLLLLLASNEAGYTMGLEGWRFSPFSPSASCFLFALDKYMKKCIQSFDSICNRTD